MLALSTGPRHPGLRALQQLDGEELKGAKGCRGDMLNVERRFLLLPAEPVRNALACGTLAKTGLCAAPSGWGERRRIWWPGGFLWNCGL